MALQRRASRPTAITNESGEPEIVLTIGDVTLSMAPPKPKDDGSAGGEKAPAV